MPPEPLRCQPNGSKRERQERDHALDQDHQVIAQEGVRAFKNSTILGYELPWNNLKSSNTAYFCLEQRHLDKKMEALRQYKSQAQKNYFQSEFILSLARFRGVQVNSRYAEAYEVMRWIVR